MTADEPIVATREICYLAAAPLSFEVFLNCAFEEARGALALQCHGGLADAAASRLAVSEGPCAFVARSRLPLILADLELSDHPSAELARGSGMRAYAGFPLLCGGRLLGTLSFGSLSRRAFKGEEITLLEIISSYVALANERKRLARMAEQRAADLERALGDKERLLGQTELLLKEVNHRVKNSLQLVASLLELQRATVGEDAARPLQEAGARVMALAKVHARLYEGTDVRQVDMDVYLRELCGDLERSAGNMRVVARVEAFRLETDRAIPVALIATEMVMNAFRHGFADGTGTTTVTLSQAGGEAVLTVTDDGRGLPADFDPRRSRGLGMRIINSLTRQLGGNLEVDSSPVGSRFCVRFPVHQPDLTL